MVLAVLFVTLNTNFSSCPSSRDNNRDRNIFQSSSVMRQSRPNFKMVAARTRTMIRENKGTSVNESNLEALNIKIITTLLLVDKNRRWKDFR